MQSNPPKYLDATIKGITIETDLESDWDGEQCYVIQYDEDPELCNYPIEWLHDEYLVHSKRSFIAPSTFLGLDDDDEGDEDVVSDL